MAKKVKGPGIEKIIKDIPMVIVNNHNEAFYYWQMSRIKDATLFHIDAHPDMTCGPIFEEELDDHSYQNLSISDFISAAFHYGITSSLYWLNPHSETKKLLDIGSTKNDNRTKIGTHIHPDLNNKQYSRIFWDNIGHLWKDTPKEIQPGQIELKDKFILDIDLDAFCSDQALYHTDKEYNGIENFEQRIDETIELLKGLKKRPNIITIARSQGKDDRHTSYIPPDKVDKVQAYLIQKLTELYAHEAQ